LNQGCRKEPPPNPYEDSLCQETNYSYERTVRIFSAFQGLAQSTVGRVFELAFHARCSQAWLPQTRIAVQSSPA